ncbi:hypothetical protein ACMHYB_45710 [Sorangium sp. So ce1128]
MLFGWLAVLLPRLVAKQRWKYKLMPLDATGTVVVPNDSIHGKDVERLFSHEHASSRVGSAMRRLVYWWQAPCAECHQEIMEKDELYLQLAPVTARLISMPHDVVRQRARHHVHEAMRREQDRGPAWSIVRLRGLIAPIAVSFFYEFVFRKECPPDKAPLFIASMADVLASTGSDSRRRMDVRTKLLRHVMDLVAAGGGCPERVGKSSRIAARG